MFRKYIYTRINAWYALDVHINIDKARPLGNVVYAIYISFALKVGVAEGKLIHKLLIHEQYSYSYSSIVL